MIFVIDKKNI